MKLVALRDYVIPIAFRGRRNWKTSVNPFILLWWDQKIIPLQTTLPLIMVRRLVTRKRLVTQEGARDTEGAHDTEGAWENDFLFDQYPDAILIVDAAGKIVGANKNLSEMFGYEKEELMGNTIEMLLPERFRKSHIKKRSDYIKTAASEAGRPMETGVKFRAMRKDGSCFPIDIMLSPAQKKGVTITVIRDISEKIATQENERKAREALKAVFDAAPVAIFSVSKDKQIISWSHAAERLFGYSANEVINRAYKDFPYIVGRSDTCLKLFNDAMSGRTVKNVHRKRRHRDGSKFDVSINTAPMYDDEGNIYAITYSAQDISERIEAQERERKTNDTLKAIVDSAPVAIFVMDKEMNVLSWSREAEQLFGFSAKEVLGKPYKLVPPDEGELNYECAKTLSNVFKGKTIRDVQRRRLTKDGALVGVSISAAPIFHSNGEIIAAAYCAQDITERLRSEEELHRLAFRDQLTGLPNRECLKKNLNELLLDSSAQKREILFVAKFHIKGFLEVSNSLGQASVEKLIRNLAKRILKHAPDNARIYRTARYDFAMAMSGVGCPLKIMDIVEPILAQMTRKFEIDGQPVHLEVDAGLAISPSHGEKGEEILANANLALNAARMDIRRNVRMFDMSMKAKIQAKRLLDIGLRHAFNENEFELFYQPQIRLSDKKLVGAEALLRWRRQERGIMQPAAFIDALAKSPIAYDMGNWIMRSAIGQAVKWQKQGLGNLRIGINLFAAQFENGTLAEDVDKALTMHDFDASLLELEITENIAIGLNKSIIEPLKVIRNKGVGIAFDDFGTGYASLSYLVNYPLSRIKIDKSFLEHIPNSEEEAAIVNAIILMAHGLGLAVIAEGVETKAQEEFLKLEKCEEVQGFYYAKPMSADEFLRFGMEADAKSFDLTAHNLCKDILGAA